MAGRIKDMRSALVAALREAGAPGSWDHITSQVRAQCFSVCGMPASTCRSDTLSVEATITDARIKSHSRVSTHMHPATDRHVQLHGPHARAVHLHARQVAHVSLMLACTNTRSSLLRLG